MTDEEREEFVRIIDDNSLISLIKSIQNEVEYQMPITFAELLSRFEERLSKEEKYRWHDLRKDPSDLPESCQNVLVIVGNPSWNHWEQAYYHHGNKQWSTYENNVIAWKYVEPFGEE